MIYTNEFEEYDRLLKEYIGLASPKNVFSLNSIPTENTLYTTINNNRYDFRVGDEIIVGNIFYRLIDISNNLANWERIVTKYDIVTVNVFSNQLNINDLYGAEITVGETTKTYQG